VERRPPELRGVEGADDGARQRQLNRSRGLSGLPGAVSARTASRS